MRVSQNHIPALLSAILFVLGALLLFGIGLLMGLAALTSLVRGEEVRAQQTILAIAFSFEGLILVAAAFVSFQNFFKRHRQIRKCPSRCQTG